MKFLIALCFTLTAAHASNPRVITEDDSRSFTSWSSEEISNYFKAVMEPKLYARCVQKTLDQDRCELLPETLIVLRESAEYREDGKYWEDYNAQMRMRFNRSDRRANAYVKTTYLSLVYWNATAAEIVASLKKRLTTQALSDCVRRTGSADKCVLQDKTLWVEKDSSFIDVQTGVRKFVYDATVSVVHLR